MGWSLHKTALRAEVPMRTRTARLQAFALSPLVACLFATHGWATENGGPSASEGLLVAQVIVLVASARILGEMMIRIGQPAVMGHLLAGILLGPSFFGWLWPTAQHTFFPPDPAQRAMISGISQFGILMLLLLAGMETDLGLVRAVRRAAIAASACGIAVPFALGVFVGLFLPENLLPDSGRRLLTSLFLGTALSIASVKIVATVVRDMGFLRRDIGQVILASAIVDDTIGWTIIAIVLGLASHGHFDWHAVVMSIGGTAAFLVLSFAFGGQIVFRLIRWSNDLGRGEAPVVATILVVMGGMALITNAIGVHTVLGAFVAGILIGQSPILTARIDEQIRGVTAGLFMPVFFALTGLSADLTFLAQPRFALLTVLLIAIASLGKAAGAFAGGELGGLRFSQSVALAAGMNARGSTEVIVASIGLSMGVLSESLFTMIVAMAFVTTMAMPPTLRWALRRLPVEEEEQRQLERETVDAQTFLARLERLLVVADNSPSGALAVHVAGRLAGIRGTPVTLLRGVEEEAPMVSDAETPTANEVARAAADVPKSEADEADPVEIIERRHNLPPEEAVAAEAQKGYDLMIVGVEPTVGPEGGFHPRISAIARAFPAALAVVSARGVHARSPDGKPTVLVPVTGSEVSRRGAELALTLGKAAGTEVTALAIIPPEDRAARNRYSTRRRDAHQTARELRLIADGFEQPIKTKQRTDLSAEDAILREARYGGQDLIVMGVGRRAGEDLSFGGIAGALLESSDRSLLFLDPGPRSRGPSP